jgi:hypothetical protein
MHGSVKQEMRVSFNLFVKDLPIPDHLREIAFEFYQAGFSDGGKLAARMTGDVIADDLKRMLRDK